LAEFSSVATTRRKLVSDAWRSYLRRARVEFESTHPILDDAVELLRLSSADLHIAFWDPVDGEWLSPISIAKYAATSQAERTRLLVAKAAPGGANLILFDSLGGLARNTAGAPLLLEVSRDLAGGLRFAPISGGQCKDKCDWIRCPAVTGPSAHRRTCVMLNLVDWRFLGSGSAQHQLGLLRAWRRSGYTVRMIAPRPAGKVTLPPDLSNALTFLPSLRQLRLPNSLDTLPQILFLILVRFSWWPQIVFSRINSLTFLLVAACRLLRLKVLVDHNGWLAKERLQSGGSRFLANLEEHAQVAAARWAHGSRCVTRGMADALRSHGVPADRLHIVGNGTDTEHFHPADRESALSSFGLPAENDYVGFLGNIVPWHRVDIAVAAFGIIAARFPKLDLLIFGDGPSLSDLRRQADDAGLSGRVRFMGRVSAERANDAINCFTLGVVPLTLQRDTAFGYSPVKIRDYAAAGCPVLTGAVPDNTDLDGFGWLFTHPPDDAQAMAQQLDMLFSEPERLRLASELARAYALAHFDWEIIGEQIMSRFETSL